MAAKKGGGWLILVLIAVAAFALGQSGGDSGGEFDVTTAATDPQWAAEQYETIADRQLTTGLFYNAEGDQRRYTSEPGDEEAIEAMTANGVDPEVAEQAAGHVEVKAAKDMADDGVDAAVLVINHPRGPCSACNAAARRILPDGAWLVVWWRTASGVMRPYRIVGGAA